MLLRPNVILDEMYLRPNVTRPNVIRRKCIRRNVTEPIQGWRFESSMALFKWRITRHTLHLNANYFVRQVSLHFLHSMLSGVREGAAPPLYACRPLRGWGEGGAHGGGSFNITSTCIFLPQVRYSGVPRWGSSPLAPPGSSRLGPAPTP